MNPKERIKELEKENKKWEEFFKSLPDGITIHGKNFVIQKSNDSVGKLLSLEKEEIVGRKCYEVYHHTNAPVEECPGKKTLQFGVSNNARIYEPTLGKYLSVLTFPITDEKGNLVGYIHSVRDVTDVVKKEERIKKESEFRNTLLRILGHDLRQPLQIIQGYSDMLCNQIEEYDSQNLKRYCYKLTRGIKQAEGIIDSIRIYTQLSSGKIPKRMITQNVEKVINRAIQSIKQRVVEKRNKIEINYHHLQKDESIKVFNGINSVLTNLLDNAIKYGPEGQIIKIDVKREDKKIVFSIEDEGMGVPKEAMEKIFQDFTRLNDVKKTPGVGLGLTIAKGLVEFFGGNIWVENVRDSGARFSFSVPQN